MDINHNDDFVKMYNGPLIKTFNRSLIILNKNKLSDHFLHILIYYLF